MTIYVDALQTFPATAYRGLGAAQAAQVGALHDHQWCHLFADQADCPELHAFAARLRLYRAWFQGDHYDLVPPRRARALAFGAVPVDRHQAVEIWRAQRASTR
jgi:hypothetical protein